MSKLVKQKSVTVADVRHGRHISFVTSDRVWISDGTNLILTNTAGDKLFHLTDINSVWGIHTVSIEGDLIYIDSEYNINKLSTDYKLKTTLINYTVPWQPQCVYSSPSTRNLLVGMFNTDTYSSVVTLYNSAGEKIQPKQCENTGQALYKWPLYITENRNGDIIVSDWYRLVVTDRGGRHRFSYTGPTSESRLSPRGICTDAMSHILVCDQYTCTVQILDQDGNFLSLIQTKSQHCTPWGLSYNGKTHSLWVGSEKTQSVNIYRCLYGKSLIGADVERKRGSGYAEDSFDLTSILLGGKQFSEYLDFKSFEEEQKYREENHISKEGAVVTDESGSENSDGSPVELSDLSDDFSEKDLNLQSNIYQQKDTGKMIERRSGDKRVPIRLPSRLRRSTSSDRINTLKRNKSRNESQILLHSIEYIDCSDICEWSAVHCSSGTITACKQSSIKDILKWTNYCSEKIEEARSKKSKWLCNTLSVLITIETKMILESVKENELQLEIIVKHFVDFAIESRNYILMTELVRLYGFHFDFGLDAIFSKGLNTVSTATVDTILQSAKYMILRKYPSLLRNSIQLSVCYDCGKGFHVTIVLLYKGTIEFDITKETVMGKKLVFYNETKPSDEALGVLRSFATSYARKPLPTITAKLARKLFNKHSNLTMISASPVNQWGI